MFVYGLAQIIRFGSSLVMTRLLLPEAFGLMALVWSVIQGLHLLSDLGISANIVQNPRGAEPAFRNTAWTIQIARGFAIAGMAMGLAPLLASFYPEYVGLQALIQGVAVNSVLYGLGSISLDILNRNMAVAKLAFLELGTQILSTVTTVLWAWYHPTPWAIVAGAWVGSFATLVASHTLFGGDRLGWDRRAAKEIFTFGKWVFVSTALMFCVGQADRLIFGVLVPASLLGAYSLGMQVAMLAPDLVMRLLGSVVFPAYCRTVQLGEELQPTFVRYRRPGLLIGGWGLAGVCGGGDAAISFLYHSNYSNAGWILQWLALGAWFGQVLQGSYSSALIALGLPRLSSLSSLVKLLGMLVLIPVGFHLGGFPGAVIGYTLSDVLRYGIAVWVSRVAGVGALWSDLRLTAWLATTAFAAWGLVDVMRFWGFQPWLQCAGVFVVVTALWLPLLLPMWREIRAMFTRRT